MKKRRKKIISIIVIVCAVVLFFVRHSGQDKIHTRTMTEKMDYSEEDYQAYLQEHEYNGVLSDETSVVDLTNYTVSDGMEVEQTDKGLYTSDDGAITWKFTIPKDGFYHLKVSYIAAPGTNSEIQRQMLLDNTSCFDAMKQIVFHRLYMDEPILKKNGNEIRPESTELFEEQTVYLEDYNRRATESFAFYLSKGEHTLTFGVIKEPIVYTNIEWCKKPAIPNYSEWLSKYESEYNVYQGDNIIGQAERTDSVITRITKSSTSINIKKNYTDATLMPYHPYKMIYNTIGKDDFAQPGNKIIWTVTAPEEGLYELSFKARQSSNRGVTSYRRITINGEVPYQEMNGVGFDYKSKMQYITMEDNTQKPYLFYLKKGENTIGMEVVLGEFGDVLVDVQESMYQLNQLYLKVLQITGQNPDKYIDYEIAKKIPEFSEIMQRESERLNNCMERIVAITGERGENTAILQKMSIQAGKLSKNPESVSSQINQVKDNVAALGTWIVTISKMPLEIDCIALSAPDAKLPKDNAGFFKNSWNGLVRFFSTFFINNNNLVADKEADNKKEIKVWIASAGKEQAQIMQNLIDDSFTPDSNISVSLQLIPADVVLRAALSGNGPDVVVGLTQAMENDFAMRGAIVDLSKLDGFSEEAARYDQSAIDAASFNEGVYGLCEQQKFMMLFYRKDIIDKLGIELPNTWDEVRKVIPVLQMHNYDFYLPSNIYPTFLYQTGGNLYQGEGKRYGESSGLYSEEAMSSFKEYTDFFTIYKLLVTADFSNHFRTGHMPLGIIDYTTYCQLEIFAPEIKGLWSFAPLPGMQKEDGSIDRSYVTDTVQSVIMSNSDDQDAAWEFVKWWTGSKTQLRFANTVESVMGSSARYPAADLSVLSSLPWNNKELDALMTQLTSCVGVPAIPGNYMTTRMIQYSFDDVAANYSNPKETLYLNIRAIDQELLKKRTEFHLNDEIEGGK